MNKKKLVYGVTEIEKHKSPQDKNQISSYDVDIDKTLVYHEVSSFVITNHIFKHIYNKTMKYRQNVLLHWKIFLW